MNVDIETVTPKKFTSPGVPLYETTEHQAVDTKQITVDALDQAARIVQAVPDGRPKESYVSAIRAFMRGRYGDTAPTPPDQQLDSIVVWAEELLDLTYIPERNCSCHLHPPCGDCVENSYTREVVERLSEAIKVHKGY